MRSISVNSDSERSDWQNCKNDCGLFLEDLAVRELCDQLADEEFLLKNFVSLFDLLSCRASLTLDHSYAVQTLWTDGACANNQDARFQRAGSDINFYLPLTVSILLWIFRNQIFLFSLTFFLLFDMSCSNNFPLHMRLNIAA